MQRQLPEVWLCAVSCVPSFIRIILAKGWKRATFYHTSITHDGYERHSHNQWTSIAVHSVNPQGFPSNQRVWGSGDILSHVAFGTGLRSGQATPFCRRSMPEGPNFSPPCLKVLSLKEASVSMLQCNSHLGMEGHKLKVCESLHCPETPSCSQLFAVLLMCS